MKKVADLFQIRSLEKEFTRLRNSDEYAWLLNVSNNVTKQAIKDACSAYKKLFFSRVYNGTQGLRRKKINA